MSNDGLNKHFLFKENTECTLNASATCCIAYYASILCRNALRNLWPHLSKGKYVHIKQYMPEFLAVEWVFIFTSRSRFSILLSNMSNISGGYLFWWWILWWWWFLVVPTTLVTNCGGSQDAVPTASSQCFIAQYVGWLGKSHLGHILRLSLMNVIWEMSSLVQSSQDWLREAACKTW